MDNISLDTKHFPRELNLILDILKKRNDGSLQITKPIDIDWGYFLKLTKHHRVYPLMYTTMNKINESLIPTHVTQSLYQEYKNNTFKMLQLSAEMEQVSKLFIENQIDLIFLKGPAIAADIYGDISLRTSKDLDVFIPISGLEKAENILLSLGYEKEAAPTVLNEWKWRSHHVAYYHQQKQIQIEIHWRLHPPPSKEPSFDDLWKRKRTSILFTYPVYFLGKEDLFIYLIVHGARHGWFRLRWLIDIDQMLKNGICTKEILSIINQYQYRYLAGQALILASQLLNSPINAELKVLTRGNHSEKLAQSSTSFIKEMSAFKYPKDYLSSIKSNKQRFISLLILFYPRPVDKETLNLPTPFHFLYFPLRPLLWVWRKSKKLTSI